MHAFKRLSAPQIGATRAKPAPVACGLFRGSPTAQLVFHRTSSCIRAASPSGQQQQTHNANPRKPSAMPQLPDRRAKGQKSDNSSSSRKRSSSPTPARRSGRRPLPLPPILPPDQQQQAQERTLAGLLAYSGLLGTVATAASMVCPDVDLFGGFSLNPADVTLGLQLLLPCCLLNLAIMLPDYSSWKVPAEPTLEAQQKMAEALLAWTSNKKAAADAAAAAVKASTAPAQGAVAADSTLASSSDITAVSTSTSTSGTDATQQQAGQDKQPLARPVQEAAASSSSSSVAEPVPAAVTPPWLINNPDPPLPLPLARCKDAMLMAQGHYLSSTPRVALPWPLQAGVLLVNCLAAELLYRSVVLQVTGGWLTDRILEAGAEDWFQSAAAQLPVLPTPHMTGQLVAVALLSGAWGIAVARQVLLTRRKPSLVMSSQGKLAAGMLLDDVQRLSANKNKQQPRQQQQQQQQRDKQNGEGQQDQQQGQEGSFSAPSMHAAAGEQNSSSTAGVDTTVSSNGTPASKQAADLAVAAAAEPVGHNTSSSKPSGRQGFSRQLPNTLSALTLQQLVTGCRDLTQSAGLGLAFALTGNLAAPFVAAVVTEGLMAVLQRRGQERSQQRSVAFAKHFASFTRVFRDVQRQQQLKQAAEQDQQAGDQQHQAAAQPPALSAGTAHGADKTVPLSSTASGGHLDSGAEDDVLDAAVAAAVAAPGAVALHAAAAAASSDIGAAGGGGAGNARMERTISVLDQLLGEQLAEQAAAAGPHGK